MIMEYQGSRGKSKCDNAKGEFANSRVVSQRTNAEREAPLGIVTKTSSTEESQDSQQLSRAARWALKSVASRLLPDTRTSKCMVYRAPSLMGGLSDVTLHKGKTTGKAFYHGLMTCGSVWTCPVCAAKISEQRRKELRAAIDTATEQGMFVYFVTLTVPHGVGDDLKELVDKQASALKRMSSGMYSVKNLLRKLYPDVEVHGYVRAFEVTHGLNGWHPHFHILVFTNSKARQRFILDAYRTAWARACRLAGLPAPSYEHGCTVQNGAEAAKYASKWGLEDEMTKSHTKKTKRKGATPWGLLRAVLDGDDVDYEPRKATALFKSYAEIFKGRRQLYWSNGLRAKLELAKELTDEQLAEKQDDENAMLLAIITPEQWKIIRRLKVQSLLLDIAELAGLQGVNAYLSSLSYVTCPIENNETQNGGRGPALSGRVPDGFAALALTNVT